MAQKSLAEWYEETYRKKTPPAVPPVTPAEVASEPVAEEAVALEPISEDAISPETVDEATAADESVSQECISEPAPSQEPNTGEYFGEQTPCPETAGQWTVSAEPTP